MRGEVSVEHWSAKVLPAGGDYGVGVARRDGREGGHKWRARAREPRTKGAGESRRSWGRGGGGGW